MYRLNQQARAYATLAEDSSLVPTTHLGSLQPPVFPAPSHSVPFFLSFCLATLMCTNTSTYIHITKSSKINLLLKNPPQPLSAWRTQTGSVFVLSA